MYGLIKGKGSKKLKSQLLFHEIFLHIYVVESVGCEKLVSEIRL